MVAHPTNMNRGIGSRLDNLPEPDFQALVVWIH